MKKKQQFPDLRIERDKLFCVSVKSHTEEELKAISDLYLTSYDCLLELKADGCQKAWFHVGGAWLVCFTSKKSPGYLQICGNYSKYMTLDDEIFISKMKQVPTPKKRKGGSATVAPAIVPTSAPKGSNSKASKPVKLEVDAILEKIFKYGIGSMTKEEKAFMDAQSKK